MNSLTISARRLLVDAVTYVKPIYLSMLIFFVPTLLITLILPTISSPSASLLVELISTVFINPFVVGASIFYAYQNLTHRGATVPASLQASGEKFFQLSLLTLILFVILIPSLLLVIPFIYLSIRLSFVFYAVMIEDCSVSDALTRSWKLTKGHWWSIFRAAFLFVLALTVPIFFLAFIVFIITSFESPELSNVIGGVIGFLTGPFTSTYYVLLFMSLVNMGMDEDAI